MAARCLQVVNDRFRAADAETSNPRSTDGLPWDRQLRSRWADVRAELDSFRSYGGRLPRIEQLLEESQGNVGSWRAGLLVANGHPSTHLARYFQTTVRALAGVPGLRSALWSVLDPGAELQEHAGPNAGVLRYHLGVNCPDGSGLRISGVTIPYVDGESVLFDDTQPHAAWNHGDQERVTLFCDILRPLPRPWRQVNIRVQQAIALDRRYRLAPLRADAWHAALNPGLPGQT